MCGDWYIFGILSVSLNCLFILIHSFIPESPRWLVSGRKFGEAGKLINEIRKKMIKIIIKISPETFFENYLNPTYRQFRFSSE